MIFSLIAISIAIGIPELIRTREPYCRLYHQVRVFPLVFFDTHSNHLSCHHEPSHPTQSSAQFALIHPSPSCLSFPPLLHSIHATKRSRSCPFSLAYERLREPVGRIRGERKGRMDRERERGGIKGGDLSLEGVACSSCTCAYQFFSSSFRTIFPPVSLD